MVLHICGTLDYIRLSSTSVLRIVQSLVKENVMDWCDSCEELLREDLSRRMEEWRCLSVHYGGHRNGKREVGWPCRAVMRDAGLDRSAVQWLWRHAWAKCSPQNRQLNNVARLVDTQRKKTLNLEKTMKTHDWFFRVNTSLLAICVVDIWLLCTGAFLAGREYISWRCS